MNERLAVAFCENGAGWGGAIISLAAFLKNKPSRIEPIIYTSRNDGEYPGLKAFGTWRYMPPVTVINDIWLKQSRIPMASAIDNLVNVAPYALRYFSAFKRDRADVVYLNNSPSSNLAAALAARLAGIPTVLHARGFNTDTRSNRWVLSMVDHCIAVSGAIRDEVVSLGLPAARCTVVPEGLDTELFRPIPASTVVMHELGIVPGQPVITLVGGLVDWKGQDILLDTCEALFAKHPEARVLIVGGAYGRDDAYAEMITKRAADPRWGGRISMLGSRSDVPALLSVSSVVLHTSTQPEPFGRTFLEGMALGKPVIASNEGGPPEVIENETDGLLIQPRDGNILAAAINRLIADPHLSATLGRNAAIKARGYSIENHVAQVGQVLQSVRQK